MKIQVGRKTQPNCCCRLNWSRPEGRTFSQIDFQHREKSTESISLRKRSEGWSWQHEIWIKITLPAPPWLSPLTDIIGQQFTITHSFGVRDLKDGNPKIKLIWLKTFFPRKNPHLVMSNGKISSWPREGRTLLACKETCTTLQLPGLQLPSFCPTESPTDPKFFFQQADYLQSPSITSSLSLYLWKLVLQISASLLLSAKAPSI